jgi:hypothetical protein
MKRIKLPNGAEYEVEIDDHCVHVSSQYLEPKLLPKLMEFYLDEMSKDKKKQSLLEQLAKLHKLGFSEKANHQVNPYILIDAINWIKNSKLSDNPVDYAKTGEDMQNLLDELTN